MKNNVAAKQSTRQSAQTFKFAVNERGRNKDWDFEKLATDYRDVEGTLEDVIDHVRRGHAIAAGLFGGKRRSKANVVGTHWILGDIDNSAIWRDENGNPLWEDGKPIVKEDGRKAKKIYDPQLTIEQALEHPFIKKYCALIYTSASHTPEWHRFRLVFRLPEYVAGCDEVEQLVNFMMEEFPFLDKSCKDASRVFFGNTAARFPLINPGAFLPLGWVQEAKEQAENEKIARRARDEENQRRKERYAGTQTAQDTDELILEALNYIPPRDPGSGNYEEVTKVAMALVSHFGEVEGERIIEQWSPTIPGTFWNVSKKVRSYKRSSGGVAIGTIFHIAKAHGFKFPVKSNLLSESDKPNPKGSQEKTSQKEKTGEAEISIARSVPRERPD